MTAGAAFSLRNNLRHLFVRPPSALPLLDGLRALSVLWVVAFHALFFAFGVFDGRSVMFLTKTPVGAMLWRGELGVDTFFVLSGYLIAGSLFDELEAAGGVSIKRFYLRRAMRLLPAYYVAMGLYALVLTRVPGLAPASHLWANVLYVNNLLPVVDQAMVWTWSLAIEEQFYMVFPWVARGLGRVGARARTAWLVALYLVFLAVPLGVAWHHGLGHRDVDLSPDGDLARWARAFDVLYDKPWTRAGALVAGALAVHLRRSTRVVEALSERLLLGVVLFAVAALIARWAMFPWTPTPWLDRAHAGASRPLFALAVGYVILLGQSTHPLGVVLAKVLGARVLYPVAQLAYSAYLLNPIAGVGLSRLLPMPHATGGDFVRYVVITVSGTFVGAAAVYVLVERPFMALRPRGAHESPADQAEARV